MKKTFYLALLPAMLFFFQSCESSHSAAYSYGGESYNSTGYDYTSREDDVSRMIEAGNVSGRLIRTEDGILNGPTIQTDALKKANVQKIIYNGYLSLTVRQKDTVSKKIEAISKHYNGYATEVGTDRVVIRVEAAFLDSAIAAIEAFGRVDHKSVNGQDVTGEYFDLQIRMENAEKARTRYLELLAKAENVQAALLVEKELERLNNEIDLVKGRMNTINVLSTYSTITVSLKEKTKLGPLGMITVGIYRGIKWLFVRG